MKKMILAVLAGITVMTMFSCSDSTEVKQSELKTLQDSASYAYGYLSGLQAKKSDKVELNAELFAKAFQQAYTKGDSNALMSEDEAYQTLQRYSAKNQQNMQEKSAELAKPNIARAEKFLEANKKNEGVKVTASGLQYKVIKQGKGPKPQIARGDRIIFHYSLSILNDDGSLKEIESNFDRQDSQPMGVDGFIPGFTEAVLMMNAGSRYTIWVHPDLGYGNQATQSIPAGSLLVFDIEVTEVLENK